MKALVFGAGGQLGQEMIAATPDGVDARGVDRATADIRDGSAVESVLLAERPAIVINAAAYTAVDLAESEADMAVAVNVTGAANLAAACARADARLLHFSTDFVFDGNASEPYPPEAATGPLGVYGQSKLDGERAVLAALPNSARVLRTSWLYSAHRSNFVKTMLRLMREKDSLSVVADQHGSPTWAAGLAEIAWRLATIDAPAGVYHWCDAGVTSWHGFAEAVQHIALEVGLLNNAIPIEPIATAAYPTAATRPGFSALDCDATVAVTGLRQAAWQDNLRTMLRGLSAS